MPSSSSPTLRLRLPLSADSPTGPGHLPAALSPVASRSADGSPLVLLDNVAVVQTWTLAPASLSADAPA